MKRYEMFGKTEALWARRISFAIILYVLASSILAAPPAGKGKDKGTSGGTPTYVPEQHILCTAPLDEGLYSRVRPVVDANGAVYVVDTSNTLYAFSDDCTELWRAFDAGNKGVDVLPDGIIITGNENWIKAYYPDGALKWIFVQDPRAFILADVAVGPDGNIYAIATSGIGVFSLDPEGNLRWKTPEVYSRNIVTYTELAFNRDGSKLAFAANAHFRSLNTADGSQVFLLGGGLIPPRASHLDDSWHLNNAAFTLGGDQKWQIVLPNYEGLSTAEISTNGIHYSLGQFGNLYAFNPDGDLKWGVTVNKYSSFQVDVDPTDSQVLFEVGGTVLEPAGLESHDTRNGAMLWQTEFPMDANFRNLSVDHLAFDATGEHAYVVTNVYGTDLSSPTAFFNVISNDLTIPQSSSILRSGDVQVDGVRLSSVRGKKEPAIRATVSVVNEHDISLSGVEVIAEWTLPDGSIVPAGTVVSSGNGQATFSFTVPTTVSGAYLTGVYLLTVTNLSSGEYLHDPVHGVTSGNGLVI
jgi:putative pyrroloquinoline-quinone binding quinoprotein